MVNTKNYTFVYFYSQNLVLFTVVPRNRWTFYLWGSSWRWVELRCGPRFGLIARYLVGGSITPKGLGAKLGGDASCAPERSSEVRIDIICREMCGIPRCFESAPMCWNTGRVLRRGSSNPPPAALSHPDLVARGDHARSQR